MLKVLVAECGLWAGLAENRLWTGDGAAAREGAALGMDVVAAVAATEARPTSSPGSSVAGRPPSPNEGAGGAMNLA